MAYKVGVLVWFVVQSIAFEVLAVVVSQMWACPLSFISHWRIVSYLLEDDRGVSNTDPWCVTVSSSAHKQGLISIILVMIMIGGIDTKGSRVSDRDRSAIQITTPYDVFGVRRKCCIMIESLKDFSSMRPIATACLDAYKMYLYTRMESSRTLNLYKFVDAGSISCGSSKEE
ncbi:uncharacterized protein E5676_scaffold83G00470 [Cucumis melo var. makuwa]|uniref:Uncharacterized protein n=1 Tax=Cucumis melo var. makuwa TaxID=1194695 RepID=A0A5D3C4T3_CUCMM|nr:uncharacterized protein E6C27_scaffold67G002350 [Cucumis melo var. makuwa]TYK05376.1 uncharacterized protein E5676_scaffold83G00470 [Cucumis melo var. makuwa]